VQNPLGCIYRGFQYQLPANYFGFPLPDDISKNLSKVAVTTVVGQPCPPCPRALPALTIDLVFFPFFPTFPPGPSADLSAFSLVLAAGVHHAYTIRYSYRTAPIPNADKIWALAQIHFVSIIVVFLFTWIAFVAQAAIIGNAVGGDTSQGDAVAVYWGQAPWLVLASAIIHIGWGYQAVRWRVALLK
jgi:hypothetical protein